MAAGRIFIGQILLVLSLIVGGIWGGTQWVAYKLGFQEELGFGLLNFGSTTIYPPWNLFIWDYRLGAYAPEEFTQGFWIVYAGIALGVVAAFLISVWRSRRKEEATTFGSAKWATQTDIAKSGLLTGKGVVLGITEDGHYLRHDGPEHVKVIAPTRSGKGVGVVIPTLLTWPGSVLVYDLKSENWGYTSGYRHRFSHVIYFNPNDPCSAHFNPLLEVRRGNLEVRDVQNIALMP